MPKAPGSSIGSVPCSSLPFCSFREAIDESLLGYCDLSSTWRLSPQKHGPASCRAGAGPSIHWTPRTPFSGRDRDLLRLRGLGLWQRHLEHAVLVRGPDLLRVHRLGQRERPDESPVIALRPVDVAAVELLLALLLAANGQDAVLDLELDVLLVHAGHLRAQDERLVPLEDLDSRGPVPEGVLGASPGITEQIVDPVLEGGHVPERVPSHDVH